MEALGGLNLEELVMNPTVAIIPVLLFLGRLLKENSKLPNDLIPWVLTLIGVIAGILFVQLSPAGVLAGIMYASIAVYGHGLFKAKDAIEDIKS